MRDISSTPKLAPQEGESRILTSQGAVCQRQSLVLCPLFNMGNHATVPRMFPQLLLLFALIYNPAYKNGDVGVQIVLPADSVVAATSQIPPSCMISSSNPSVMWHLRLDRSPNARGAEWHRGGASYPQASPGPSSRCLLAVRRRQLGVGAGGR